MLTSTQVADFGASGDVRSLAAISMGAIALHGTPPYMAPEMVTREGHGKAADVWSYGCVLAHMGARAPPFTTLGRAATAETVMSAVVEGVHTPLDLANETNTPLPVLELARRCVQPSAIERPAFEHMAELLVEPALLGAVRPTATNPRPVVLLTRRPAPAATSPRLETFLGPGSSATYLGVDPSAQPISGSHSCIDVEMTTCTGKCSPDAATVQFV